MIHHAATLPDHARLINAGWTHTRSNRWTHPAFPAAHGRIRLFTLTDALTLLDADPSTKNPAKEANA